MTIEIDFLLLFSDASTLFLILLITLFLVFFPILIFESQWYFISSFNGIFRALNSIYFQKNANLLTNSIKTINEPATERDEILNQFHFQL